MTQKLFVLFLLGLLPPVPGAAGTWDLTPLLYATGRGEASAVFDELVQPLSAMARLSYTRTAGSYFKPASSNETVPGWRRALTVDPSAGYGMRAVVFIDEEEERAVVAFRGTDLDNSTAGGQADLCMDALAASNNRSSLPPFCSRFPEEAIDYMQSVKRLLASPPWRLPGRGVLFTGHSLGCALAVLARPLVPGSRAVCFSQPPIAPGYWRGHHGGALAEPSALGSAAAASHRGCGASPLVSVVLADDQDPVAASAEGLVRGEECFWTSEPSLSCRRCRLPSPPATGGGTGEISAACRGCFLEKHSYGHYLRLVNHTAAAAYACRRAADPRCD